VEGRELHAEVLRDLRVGGEQMEDVALCGLLADAREA